MEVGEMSNIPHQVEFTDEELKILPGILKFALENCPIEATASGVDITTDRVQNLIAKLEKR